MDSSRDMAWAGTHRGAGAGAGAGRRTWTGRVILLGLRVTIWIGCGSSWVGSDSLGVTFLEMRLFLFGLQAAHGQAVRAGI